MSKYYYKFTSKDRNKVRILGFSFIGMGLLLLAYFVFPIVSYNLFLSPAFASGQVQTPIPQYLVASQDNSFLSLLSQGFSSLTSDYTDARNWYPKIAPRIINSPFAQSAAYVPRKVDSYYLSIPSLGIDNAVVSTTSYDLSKNLVQYYGPSDPTQRGTDVIYGHSTIPQWFDPHNYKAIFATLHTIKEGDSIILNVAGTNYTYKIFSVQITDPEDTNIFAQSYDNSYVTIVTCTPPGTTWKRLVVRASLQI